MRKNLLSIVICCALIFSLAVPAMAAPALSDMPNDYSTTALQAAVANGLLTGDNDKIMPNDNLTRAQMAAVIGRAFGATKQASLAEFTDVPASAWYFAYMGKAVQMKAFNGSAGKLNPEGYITRQEAFAVLARALKLADGTAADIATFADAKSISSWAVGTTAAMLKSGFIHGTDGKVNPTANITRKDFAVMMDNIIKNYISKAGTYSEVGTGSVMINVPDVTLKNVTIKGNLIIGDGVGEGNVTLDNVKVEGATIVRGGGVNSFIVKGGSALGTIVISKVDGNVRISVEGDAKVEIVEIKDGKDDVFVEGKIAKLEVSSYAVPVVVQNAKIGEINITSPLANVTIAKTATVKTVTTDAPATTLLVEGTVSTVNTGEHATGAKVEVAKGAAVGTVNAAAYETEIKGEGRVENANVTANNVKVDTAGTQTKVNSGVTGTTQSGKGVGAGTTTKTAGTLPSAPGAGGSTGDGGGYVPYIPVASDFIAWKTPAITTVAKDATETGNPPYQLMQINYNRKQVVESSKLTITDKADSKKVYLTTSGATTQKSDAMFQWSYRDLSSYEDGKTTQEDLDKLERNNDKLLPVNTEVLIKIEVVKNGKTYSITQEYKITAEDVAAASWVDSEGAAFIEWATSPISAMAKGTSNNNPYQLMQINYNRKQEVESSKLTITDKADSKKVYLTTSGKTAKNADAIFQWSYRDLHELANDGNNLAELERTDTTLLPVGTLVEIKIEVAVPGDKHYSIKLDYKITHEDVDAASWSAGAIAWNTPAITTIAKDSKTAGDPPYQLMQINYNRKQVVESSKLTITDKADSKKVYLTTSGATTQKADAMFQWSYRDLHALTPNESNLAELERTDTTLLPVGTEVVIKIDVVKGGETYSIKQDYTITAEDVEAASFTKVTVANEKDLMSALSNENIKCVTFTGTDEITSGISITDGKKLVIDKDATLTITDSATLTVCDKASLLVNGKIINNGTIENKNDIDVNGTLTSKTVLPDSGSYWITKDANFKNGDVQVVGDTSPLFTLTGKGELGLLKGAYVIATTDDIGNEAGTNYVTLNGKIDLSKGCFRVDNGALLKLNTGAVISFKAWAESDDSGFVKVMGTGSIDGLNLKEQTSCFELKTTSDPVQYVSIKAGKITHATDTTSVEAAV